MNETVSSILAASPEAISAFDRAAFSAGVALLRAHPAVVTAARYAAYAVVAWIVARDIYWGWRRARGKDDPLGWPLSRRLATQTIIGAALAAAVALLPWALTLPHRAPVHILTAAWFAVALAVFLPLKLVTKRPRIAGAAALVIADGALVWASSGLVLEYAFLPRFSWLLVEIAVLHLAVMAWDDAVRMLGSGRGVAALLALAAVAGGRLLEHRSWVEVETLDRPGRVSRVAGAAEEPIAHLYVDERTGFLFWVTERNRTRVVGLDPQTGERFVFEEKNERFGKLLPGEDEGSLLVLSEKFDGRGAYLLNVPDLSVRAVFPEGADTGYKQGPETYGGEIAGVGFVSSVVQNGETGVRWCPKPVQTQDAAPGGSTYCRFVPLPMNRPSSVFLDDTIRGAYLFDAADAFHPSATLHQVTMQPFSPAHALGIEPLAPAMAMSPTRRLAFIAATLEKRIYYIAALTLQPVYQVGVHIYPTAVVYDGDKYRLYLGGWFDGAVQVLRAKDGQVTRPIFMGPGLRELALDRAHNVLYAATDIGVTALQLSMVPMPTGVKRIERDEIEFN